MTFNIYITKIHIYLNYDYHMSIWVLIHYVQKISQKKNKTWRICLDIGKKTNKTKQRRIDDRESSNVLTMKMIDQHNHKNIIQKIDPPTKTAGI